MDCVNLESIILPEFDHNKMISHQGALVFDGSHTCDMISRRDFLHFARIMFNCELKMMQWLEKSMCMKDKSILKYETHLILDECHPQAFSCSQNNEYITIFNFLKKVLHQFLTNVLGTRNTHG